MIWIAKCASLQVNDTHPLNGTVHNLTPGQSLTIQLAREKVPDQAYQVVIYAILASGYYDPKDVPGEMTVSTTIPNGVIERKLYCYVYNQSAWSYNSENITLPVAPNSRVVNVSLKVPQPTSGTPYKASVQVVGYSL